MIDLFYCYAHRKKDTGSIFYFGKGRGIRAWQTTNRNKHWHNVVGKHGIIVEIIYDQLLEHEALRLEMKLISEGRRQGLALVNRTDGGEGVSGFQHSDITKQKIRQKMLVIANSEIRKVAMRKTGLVTGRRNVENGHLQNARSKSPVGKKGNSGVKYTNAKRWGIEKEHGLWISKKTGKILLDTRKLNG